MGIITGYYSIADIKALFKSSFKKGDLIETLMCNTLAGSSLRLRYKILSLEEKGVVCRLIEQEWNDKDSSRFATYYEEQIDRFIHNNYLKYFDKK